MTRHEDIAAAQTVEGVLGVIDLMDRLQAIAKWDIRRAVALYFQWKGLCESLGRYAPNGEAKQVGYGQEMARGATTPPGREQPAREATHA